MMVNPQKEEVKKETLANPNLNQGEEQQQPKTAEELRQQKQRDETQAFLDQQEIARQTMAAETKAREQREAKAAKK